MAEGQRRRPCRGRAVGSVGGDGRPRLTVLGSSCSIPRPGRACSSYLIEYAGTTVVADLGSGAFANLLAHRSLDAIDALVISHMHADHFIDIIPLRYALTYGERTRRTKLPLYLPPGGIEMLRQLTTAFHPERDSDFLGNVFEVMTFEPARGLRVKELEIRFAPTTHYIPTFAMRFVAGDAAIAYSSDTAPDDRVVALAEGADLFICEATLSTQEEAGLPRAHLSAREAAGIARRAGVAHLLLTHYPGSLQPAALERDAAAAYGGRLTVADDGLCIEV